jgi:twitching motility protein PilT
MMDQFRTFVAAAYKAGATDILMKKGFPTRLRIGGRLVEHKKISFDGRLVTQIAKAVLAQDEMDFLRATRSVKGLFPINETMKLRFTFSFDRSGLCLYGRLLPAELRTWDSLGVPKIALNFLQKKQGLILLSGPLSSGKTSTLVSFIEYMNQIRREHIIYVDELIEYKIKSSNCVINLRQLRRDTASYSTALKYALREDPDVVVIGDISEPESACFALNIAETGHLVVAGTSTLGSVNTIFKILNLFPVNELDTMRLKLASYLIGVISQALVPDINNVELLPLFEVATITNSVANCIRKADKMIQLRSEVSRSISGLSITFEDYAEGLKKKGLLSPSWNVNSIR